MMVECNPICFVGIFMISTNLIFFWEVCPTCSIIELSICRQTSAASFKYQFRSQPSNEWFLRNFGPSVIFVLGGPGAGKGTQPGTQNHHGTITLISPAPHFNVKHPIERDPYQVKPSALEGYIIYYGILNKGSLVEKLASCRDFKIMQTERTSNKRG